MTTTHPGHGRILCSCGRIIAQCRCMGNDVVLETRPHPACGEHDLPEDRRPNVERDRDIARSALVEIRDIIAANAKDYEQHVRVLARATLLKMSGLFDE